MSLTTAELREQAKELLIESAMVVENPLQTLQYAILAYDQHLKQNPGSSSPELETEIYNAARAMLLREFGGEPIAHVMDEPGTMGVALRLNPHNPIAIPYKTEEQRDYIVRHLSGWVFQERDADRIYRQGWLPIGIVEAQQRRDRPDLA